MRGVNYRFRLSPIICYTINEDKYWPRKLILQAINCTPCKHAKHVTRIITKILPTPRDRDHNFSVTHWTDEIEHKSTKSSIISRKEHNYNSWVHSLWELGRRWTCAFDVAGQIKDMPLKHVVIDIAWYIPEGPEPNWTSCPRTSAAMFYDRKFKRKLGPYICTS